ncbi:MAG: hypothetical protein L6R48_14255 [Planctomycetes bacterium]|nr:hypothetical protein [Planctomycetota bacterium]
MLSLRRALLLLLPILALAAAEPAKPLLHPIFGEHMVFPHGRRAALWGWAPAGARVQVSLAGQQAEAVAGADGRWQAELGPVAAGGPYELVVAGPQQLVLKDVLAGEVLLCSGQSNMAMGLNGAEGGREEAAGAASAAASVRLLHLGMRIAGTPRDLPTPANPVQWRVPAADNLGGFSAVGWFTARSLQQRLKIPVGVVACAWGGTNIRAWMAEESLARLGLYGDERDLLRTLAAAEAAGAPPVPQQEREQVAAWWKEHDPGSAAGFERPAEPATGAWSDQELPGAWKHDGTTWLRRTVQLPAAAVGKPGRLLLGGLPDDSTVWVNGAEVGTGRGAEPRNYRIDARQLAAAPVTVAIRVWSEGGRSGGKGSPGDWRLESDAGTPPVALAGAWRRAATTGVQPVRPRLRLQGGNGAATMLYNGGIRPLAPFAFSGAVWYQGEQDAGNSDYQRMLAAMIGDWRALFGKDLPVVVVGLPGFHDAVATPVEERLNFGATRLAQAAAALALPGVGLAVITDLGDAKDVHPTRKRAVGERAAAALVALREGAGGGGPLIVKAERAGAAMRLTCQRVSGGGLELRAGEPSGFALKGADGAWHHARARLDGDTVVVESPEVPEPVAVRYGWANNPPCTLYDRAGFPAAPFGSDRR